MTVDRTCDVLAVIPSLVMYCTLYSGRDAVAVIRIIEVTTLSRT